MTLHIVSKSPYTSSALKECLGAFASGDALLLIEDGTYVLRHPALETLQSAEIYCLEADAAARGQQQLAATMDRVEMINDARWVQLCTEHQPIVSWFR
ncbi:sulfurtransferase complex subunit TusB [Microbulbifer sp. OS29]|uniref:Sulfurtransferase complex subunit TusB n=1 Tax=Microbulbifer okhotskensis TaxID=2926617 RepID=A0A9X2EU62_9GAMM|nr:sulfurtransferase complex subunit TusB [Microbulbifer okhotskensis]MCO1335886.1 sulfurtransferase complex subunit TusB [Microbulbifer okhotskensis]